MVTAIIILVHALGVWNAGHAVMNVRSSQGAIAWSLVLIAFPWIALPMYWVLGRWKFRGYMEAFHQVYSHFSTEILALYEAFLCYEKKPSKTWHSLHTLAQSLTEVGFTAHNSIRLLCDGEQTFSAMLTAIAQAQDYILLQTYILRDDPIGTDVQQALIDRAQQGVRVYLLYDAIGSHRLSKRYLRQLKESGIHVAAFRSTRGWRARFQINFRNHRKILIVDGQTGFVGGLNIGDEYLGKEARFGPWRDTHIQLWGPSVQCLQEVFCRDWYWSQRFAPEANWQATDPPDGKDQLALIFPSGPIEPIDDCTYLYCHLIHSARNRLWLASPYLVPSESVITALKTAAIRGVEVRILLPAHADHLLVYLSSFSYCSELQEAGISIYRYQPGFMHQKVVLVDDAIAAVGTVNLDNRSFRLNFEIMAFVDDLTFVEQVEAMLMQDFEQSCLVNFNSYKQHWVGFKLSVHIARLMAPLQ